MRITHNLTCKMSLCLEQDNIIALFNLVNRKYEKVEIRIITTKGLVVDLDSLDSLLKYDNFSELKIKSLTFANKYLSDGYMTMNNDYQSNASIDFSYKANDHNESILIRKELDEIIKKAKTNYNITSRLYFYLMNYVRFMVIGTFAILFILLAVKQVDLPKTLYIILQVIYFVFLSFSFFENKYNQLMDNIIPKVVFCIGEEIKYEARREKLRSNLIWGVLVSIIVSVISTIVLSSF